MPTNLTRLSINITPLTDAEIRDLADKKQTSITDIVRRAISLYYAVEEETARGRDMAFVSRDRHGNREIETMRVL